MIFDIFNRCLVVRAKPAKPYLTTCPVASLTRLRDHLLYILFITSSIPSFRFFVRRGSSAVTSFQVLLLSTLRTYCFALSCLFRWHFCCVQHVQSLSPLPSLKLSIVSSRTLSADTCERVNSAILFISSSFFACSAKRTASVTFTKSLFVDQQTCGVADCII